MANSINNMTRADIDALANHALAQQKAAQTRAKKYRDKKKSAGFVQISVWVPKAKAHELKRTFDAHVVKITAPKSASQNDGVEA